MEPVATLASADAATTLASEETAPKVAAFLYLEEVIALQRCSRQHARDRGCTRLRNAAPGAPKRRACCLLQRCKAITSSR